MSLERSTGKDEGSLDPLPVHEFQPPVAIDELGQYGSRRSLERVDILSIAVPADVLPEAPRHRLPFEAKPGNLVADGQRFATAFGLHEPPSPLPERGLHVPGKLILELDSVLVGVVAAGHGRRSL